MNEWKEPYERPRDLAVWQMTYEGDRGDFETLMCIYTNLKTGQAYRVQYKLVHALATLYSVPEELRRDILFWAKMINNPD